MTDAEGRGVIPGLPADCAIYLVHDHPDFAEFKGRNSRSLRAGGEEQTFQLEPGASISGRVILPNGSPVSGAEITLREERPYTAEYSAATVSRLDGTFRLDRVPVSRYSVTTDLSSIMARGAWIGPSVTAIDARQPVEIPLGDLKASAASVVTVRILDAVSGKELADPIVHRCLPGETTIHYRSSRMCPPGYAEPPDLRLTLKENEWTSAEFRLPPVPSFSGVVRDAQGKPVKGAAVFGTFPQLTSSMPTYAESDENGRYVITPPRDGAESHWVILYAAALDGSAMSNLLDVRAAPSDNHHLVIDPSTMGRVTGTVVDETGQPVPGVDVSWSPSEIPVHMVFQPATLVTDAAGKFEFPVVWPDVELAVTARKEGYVQRRPAVLMTKKGQATPVQVTVAIPKESVEGVVLRPDGSPAAGVAVHTSGQGQDYVSTETSADGTFRLQGLFPGQVHVRALEHTEASSPTRIGGSTWGKRDGWN